MVLVMGRDDAPCPFERGAILREPRAQRRQHARAEHDAVGAPRLYQRAEPQIASVSAPSSGASSSRSARSSTGSILAASDASDASVHDGARLIEERVHGREAPAALVRRRRGVSRRSQCRNTTRLRIAGETRARG